MKKFASVVALAVIFGLGGANAASAVTVPNRKAVVKVEKERNIVDRKASVVTEKER